MVDRILIIDDEAHRHEVVSEHARKTYGAPLIVSAYTAVSAIEMLRNEPRFELIFFDNDLGSKGGEGKDVAKALLNELPDKLPDAVVVHSMNSGGPADSIASLFETYNRVFSTRIRVARMPFNMLLG